MAAGIASKIWSGRPRSTDPSPAALFVPVKIDPGQTCAAFTDVTANVDKRLSSGSLVRRNKERTRWRRMVS